MLVWGAVLGSAANALIDRLPRGESWAAGRSKCDKCKHVLAWYDLIPLLSYLVLRGKCRYCGQKISWRNFFVELIMSVGFVTVYQGLGVSVQSVSVMGIMWVTTIIAIMDWETKLVSEVMVGLWAALVVVSRLSNLGDLSYLGGMAMGVVIIGGIWAISRGKAMGFGDVEIAAVMGYGLGWPKIAAGLWVAALAEGVWLPMRRKRQFLSRQTSPQPK